MNLPLRDRFDRYISIAMAIFGVWLLLVLISPFLVPNGQLDDLSGKVLEIDNAEKFEGINPVAWTVYMFGDANCHQISERSYFLNENQMPFCTRDLGIFIGVFAGSILMFLFSLHIRWQWLILAVIPLAIDGIVQEVTAYESTNEIRMVTGIIAGTAGAMFLCEHIAMPTKKVIEAETVDQKL